jgi:pilus assembly protein Flp/PilA
MFRTISRFRRFLADKQGVSMIEYCLVAVLIAIASLVIVTTAGSEVSALYSKINSALSSAAS